MSSRIRCFPWVGAFGIVLALNFCSIASASTHNLTELVSTGPTGGDHSCNYCQVVSSPDASRVFFSTSESLVSADTDGGKLDVYLRAGGTTTLITNGTTEDVFLVGGSQDASRIFLSTSSPLVPEDTDSQNDVYEWQNGTFTLVSSKPDGSNGPLWAGFVSASTDGTRVLFSTDDQLVTTDVDSTTDLYERAGGTTTLMSTGSVGGNGPFPINFYGQQIWSNDDGTHVFFTTSEALEPEDLDTGPDIYERSGGTTKLVSTGPTASLNGPPSYLEAVSADGTHAFFSTQEALVPQDTDSCTSAMYGTHGCADVYERSGGTTTLVSTGPTDAQLSWACTAATIETPCYGAVKSSSDGLRAFFFSGDHLTPDDTDGRLDLYERDPATATTTRLSTGPTGGNGNYPALNRIRAGQFGQPLLVSKDGNHVLFETQEPLVASDADGGKWDVYERTGGTTNLVSTGPTDNGSSSDAFSVAISVDGNRAFFDTPSNLVPTDTDNNWPDLYERAGGVTTLISTGPTDTGNGFSSFIRLSPDQRHVFFVATSGLVSSDTDNLADIYMRSVGYQTPASASSLSVSLVPAFRQCGTGGNPVNSAHAPPLGTGSCNPPRPGSVIALFGPQAVGSAQLTAVPGDPTTAADEADVGVTANLTDIQAVGGGDYVPNASGPDLELVARLRTTDAASCTPGPCSGLFTEAATSQDLDFAVPVDCAATPDPTTGSACAVNTTADTIDPGMIGEGRETILQSFRLRVDDAGANGVPGDSDDRIFSTQGIFAP